MAHGTASLGLKVHIFTVESGQFVLYELKSNGKRGISGKTVIRSTYGPTGRNEFTRNFYSVSAARALEQAIKTSQPDIVHIHGIHQFFTLSSLKILKEFRVPSLLTIHDYKILCGNSSFFSDRKNGPCIRCLGGRTLPPLSERCKQNSIVKSAATSLQMSLWKLAGYHKYLTAIHVSSRFVFDLLRQNPVIGGKLVEIRFPIMRDMPQTRRSDHLNNNILYIGRMVPHKGALLFAEAIRGIEAAVDVFGDGPEFQQVQAILGGQPGVTLHGWKTHEEMSRAMGVGSIAVLPYLAHETFCFAVLEAMAHGCCVVTSARGAIPELVKDGVNGVCLQEPSGDEFRRAINGLIAEPRRVASMGHKARETIGELNSMKEHSVEIGALYRSLVSIGSEK